jgi:uncharacterized membrane protein
VARVVGVDVARGLALLGMFAVHVFPTFRGDGGPTAATLVAGGRSAATFVLVAGIGLAFVSGGRIPVRGVERVGVSAGLVVRAALIGGLGLVLGVLSTDNRIYGILPYYGLFFLLAVPLIGLSARGLAGVAAAFAVLGPVLLVTTADADLPGREWNGDPTFPKLFDDPAALLTTLTVTGEYPAVVYLAYLCAGMAVGRLDLRSRRVAWSLVGVGAGLAVAAQVGSAVVLSGRPLSPAARWQPELSASWWYLALPAPHSHSLVDVGHVLGSALVVVGGALLLTRIRAAAWVLAPLAAAGSMALTLYSTHLVVLAADFFDDDPLALYLLIVVPALVFALVWRWLLGRGPLERVVTAAAGGTRRATTALLTRRGAPVPGAPPPGGS